MPSWSEIITDVNLYSNAAVELDKKREEYLNKIHSITGRNVIAYYSGWLKAPDAPHVSIDEQDKNALSNLYTVVMKAFLSCSSIDT